MAVGVALSTLPYGEARLKALARPIQNKRIFLPCRVSVFLQIPISDETL